MATHQQETLGAASVVAESIAQKFLQKQQRLVDDSVGQQLPELKGKGNRSQFKFCQDILRSMDRTLQSMTDNELDSAKVSLSEGKKLIHKRMKLIRLADREDWATVNEYVSDDMASNSEDEKRIARARRAAAAKSDKRRKLSRSYRQRNRERPSPLLNNIPLASPRFLSSVRSTIEPKQCWACGRQGHFFSVYPFNDKYTNKNQAPVPAREFFKK